MQNKIFKFFTILTFCQMTYGRTTDPISSIHFDESPQHDPKIGNFAVQNAASIPKLLQPAEELSQGLLTNVTVNVGETAKIISDMLITSVMDIPQKLINTSSEIGSKLYEVLVPKSTKSSPDSPAPASILPISPQSKEE